MSKNSNKIEYFEYLIDKLAENNNNSLESFSTIKLIKLLFLVVGVSSSESDEGLISIFDNFVAMPYGPVESDIYNAIQQGSLNRYDITTSGCKKKSNVSTIRHDTDEKTYKSIDRAVISLLERNPDIIKCQPFELVDITHKWSCWRICYWVALENNKNSIQIPSEMIQKSIKYYK